MNKIILIIIFTIFVTGCSLNKNSKFWTSSQNIKEENNKVYKQILTEEDALNNEFNANKLIKINDFTDYSLQIRNHFNNDGRLRFDGKLKKILKI